MVHKILDKTVYEDSEFSLCFKNNTNITNIPQHRTPRKDVFFSVSPFFLHFSECIFLYERVTTKLGTPSNRT